MGHWCILRTGKRQTLRLAKTLAEDGYEVWTPAETKVMRVPRANVRREVTEPMLPGFLFARSTHLIDLLELSKLAVKPRRGAGCKDPAHDDFTVMRCNGRIPIIADRDLDDLRRIEARRPRKRASQPFAAGAIVRVTEGPATGMTGTVAGGDRKHTAVCFNGRFVVKIATSLLTLDQVNAMHSDFGVAVQAA